MSRSTSALLGETEVEGRKTAMASAAVKARVDADGPMAHVGHWIALDSAKSAAP